MDRNRLWVAPQNLGSHVALRKESVDRNSAVAIFIRKNGGRSPQGERG